MVKELADIIRRNFQIVNPKNVLVLNSGVRLEINLQDERLIRNINRLVLGKSSMFNNHELIEQKAGKIFDIDFLYETRGEIGPAVFFMPSESDRYSQNHKNHYIQVHLPNFYPLISISTGNVGSSLLLKEQREKYLQFVKEIYDIFLTRYI